MVKSVMSGVTAVMLLAGCSSVLQQSGADGLANRSFVLTGVDGEFITAPDGIRPGITFSADLHVSGVMCNRFFGQGTLKGNLLRVPHLTSTAMMCRDPRLNQWALTISQMLASGATVKLAQKSLVLEGAGHRLVYQAQ